MTRTDPHSPTNLVTEDYTFGYAYDSQMPGKDYGFRRSRLINDGWKFASIHGGNQCDHCGAHLRYIAVLKHEPTKTLVTVGETCLDSRFERATAEFHALRKASAIQRERARLLDRKGVFIADPRNAEAVDYAREAPGEFYASIYSGFVRYGTLSERQVDAVLTSKTRDAERAAQRAAEALTASPVVAGRIEILGEVQSVKLRSNAYGERLVMVVRDERGFKVWGTVPASLDPVKGSRVAFTATVEASETDPTFGFFKRPSKAVPLAEAT